MTAEQPLRVNLFLHRMENAAAKSATLLQRGFSVPVTGTVSIAELLTGLPGFSEEYIKDRVQTIFVNGLAEDNTNRKLTAGDTLALSAAMPGLAGAIFRRGGQHASLRTRPIKEHKPQTLRTGHITLKLFNMIATETGPRLLETGILIKGKTLARFLDQQGKRMLPLIERVEVEKSVVPVSDLAGLVENKQFVFITTHS
jgi:hypothetical protein